MIASGWYEDPDNSELYRYWSGNAWTEHRQPKQVAISQGSKPGVGAPENGVGPEGDFGSTFDWLGNTFKIPFQNFAETFLFFFLAPIVIFGTGIFIALSGIDFEQLFDQLDEERFSFSDFWSEHQLRFYIAAALQPLSIIPRLIGTHQFLAAHKKALVPFGFSAKKAVQRFPAAVAAYLIGLVAAAVSVAPLVIASVIARSDTVSGLAGLIFIGLGVIWLVAVGLFLSAHVAVLEVAAIAAPSASSFLRAALAVSSGRVRKIVIRLLVLGCALAAVTFLALIVLLFFTSLLGAFLFFAPAAGAFLTVPILILPIFATQVIVSSGMTGLYANAKAPDNFPAESDQKFEQPRLPVSPSTSDIALAEPNEDAAVVNDGDVTTQTQGNP